MNHNLAKNLAALSNNSVRVFGDNIPLDAGQATAVITFANGTEVRISYWRLIKDGRAFMSSFDHLQKYGLPAPIDAITTLRTELDNSQCTAVQLDGETGDLILHFSVKLKLQIFNFTGYEIWEISFPDGTGQYSNYVLSE